MRIASPFPFLRGFSDGCIIRQDAWDSISRQETIWQGDGLLMAGDHSVSFSKPASSFRTLFFVWSNYTGGVVRDYNFNVTSLPSAFVAERPGVSTIHTISSSASGVSQIASKLLYVSGTYAAGNDVNKQADNSVFVLREVIGVG